MSETGFSQVSKARRTFRPPEGVAIFSIEGFSFLNICRNLDAKLVGASGLDLGDDAPVSLTEGKWYPPCKGSFI
jgi:hypothetical protein